MAARADGWLRLAGGVRFWGGWQDGSVKAVSSHRRRRAIRTEVLNLSTWILRHASRTAGFLPTPPIQTVMAVHPESSAFLFENRKACVCGAPLGLLSECVEQQRRLLLIPEFCPVGQRQRLTLNNSTLLV